MLSRCGRLAAVVAAGGVGGVRAFSRAGGVGVAGSRRLLAPLAGLGRSEDMMWADQAELEKFLLFYSLKQPNDIPVGELLALGQSPSRPDLLVTAQFLHEEIPVRLAHMVRSLKRLPLGLGDTRALVSVRRLYEESFRAIRSLPTPSTFEEEERFTNVLRDVKRRQLNVNELVGDALRELCTTSECARRHNFAEFLDEFYSCRIGVWVLLEQHIALHEPRDGFVGIVESRLSPLLVAKQAADTASKMCSQLFGHAPCVEFEGCTDCRFAYIPSHIHFVLVEMLKNSMRATCEFNTGQQELPPITVVFAEGEKDVCVKISDVGGGIDRDGLARIWDYSYSTVKPPGHAHGVVGPMAGFGHGLPFSRLYCRYLAGNLQVISMEGYGTDVYVYLSKIERVCECTVC